MSINYRPVQDVGSSQPVIVKSATDFGRDFDFHLLVQARNQIGISDCQLEQKIKYQQKRFRSSVG
jgi:hypothetical protein